MDKGIRRRTTRAVHPCPWCRGAGWPAHGGGGGCRQGGGRKRAPRAESASISDREPVPSLWKEKKEGRRALASFHLSP